MWLAMEIGGTKLQAALASDDGGWIAVRRVGAGATADVVFRQMVELADGLLVDAHSRNATVRGVGVGFGGPIDIHRGVVLTSHQVPGWDQFPLAARLRERLGLSVAVGNDSDLAGLAEANLGAGKGCSPVVYMNIGSGIGGALVIGGELHVGQGVGSMEIGHLRVTPGAPGGPWRTLESLASGWSLGSAAREAARRFPHSLLWTLADNDANRMTPAFLADAARQGDPAALDVWREAVGWLGLAIANVVTLLAPEIVVLGGGVALVGDALLEPLRQQIARQVFPPFASTFRLAPAALGEEVVLHGALHWARRRLG